MLVLIMMIDNEDDDDDDDDNELTYHEQQSQYSRTTQLAPARPLYVAVQNVESTEYSLIDKLYEKFDMVRMNRTNLS